MAEFRKNMDTLFEITKHQLRGDVVVSDTYVYTKHDVTISYTHQGQKYSDLLFVEVGKQIKDPTQHHIKQLKCT